jgi:hypothetical protein
VDGCCEDVPGLAHWWSNCLHLRWMLWAMCRGDDDGSPDEFDWVMQARTAFTSFWLRVYGLICSAPKAFGIACGGICCRYASEARCQLLIRTRVRQVIGRPGASERSGVSELEAGS